MPSQRKSEQRSVSAVQSAAPSDIGTFTPTEELGELPLGPAQAIHINHNYYFGAPPGAGGGGGIGVGPLPGTHAIRHCHCVVIHDPGQLPSPQVKVKVSPAGANGFPKDSKITVFVMPLIEDADGNPLGANGRPLEVPRNDANNKPPVVLKPNVSVNVGPVAIGQAIFIHYTNLKVEQGRVGGTNGCRVTVTT